MIRRVVTWLPRMAASLALFAAAGEAQSRPDLANPAPNALFELTKVTEVHLSMSKQQFAALAPAGGFFGRFGGGFGRGNGIRLQGAEGKRNGLSAAAGIEFNYVHADVTIGGRPLKDIGVRYKGNGTYMQGQMSGKISLKLDLNRFAKGQKLNGVKTLNLHSNVADGSYMNEELAFRLYRDAGVGAPRTSYAKVYLKIAGEENESYLGLYSLVENPDEDFIKARGLPENGAIFKPVTPSLFNYLGPDWPAYNQTYDPKTSLTPAQKQRVIDASRLVTSASGEEFNQRIAGFLDLDSWARYMAANVFLADTDGILGTGQNYYLYLHPETNRFSPMAWDQDHSFGQFRGGGANLDILHPGRSRFLERLFAVESFRSLYLRYMKEFTNGIFGPAKVNALVDRVAAAIRPAIEEESQAKLAGFDGALKGESASGGFMRPFGGALPIKPFVEARSRAVLEQLNAIR